MDSVKEDHFRNLVAVAFADGVLDKAEEELLTLKAIEYGLPQPTVDFIMSEAENLEFIIPRTIIDREHQISEAVNMATIDGEIHNKEYQLLISLALRLGFQNTDVDSEIDKLSLERDIVVHK